MDNYCDSCIWWCYTYTSSVDLIGLCGNDLVPDQLRITDENDLDEPTLFTAATFGCIHHQCNHKKAVTPINFN